MAILQEEDDSTKQKVDEMTDAAPVSAGDPVATAAVASVLFSWYNFYVRGDKERGIFVGLWAPTLLAAASYLQQKDIIQRFKRGLETF